MTDEYGYTEHTFRVSTHDALGNDISHLPLGPGGRRREDGTLAALARPNDDSEDGYESSDSLAYYEPDENTDEDSEYEYESDEDEWSGDESDSGLGGALAGLALVGLTVGAVGLFGAAAKRRREREELEAELRKERRKEERRARKREKKHFKRRERREQELHEARLRRVNALTASTMHETHPVQAPPGWYDDGFGRDRWWDGQRWTAHYRQDANAAPLLQAGWYDDGLGSYRWWDGRAWTNHVHATLPPAGHPHLSDANPSQNPQTGLPVPRQDASQGEAMSREEWGRRMRWMFLSRAFSEEQWARLTAATIVDADGSVLQWQAQLRQLTPQRFTDLIREALDRSPALRHEADRSWTTWAPPDPRDMSRQPEPVAIGQLPVDDAIQRRQATASPGWYDDGSGQQRWWDGQRWV